MMVINYSKKNQNSLIYKISVLIAMIVINQYVMQLNLLMKNRLLRQVFMIQKFIWYRFFERYLIMRKEKCIFLFLGILFLFA